MPGYAALGLDSEAGDPIFTGPQCQQCGPGFTPPACWSCTARGNCSTGAVGARVVDGGCVCVCHEAYSGALCADCASNYEKRPLPAGGNICVGSRGIRVSPEYLEGEDIATIGAEVVISIAGDSFVQDAALSVSAPGAPVQLSSDYSNGSTGMEHAFTRSLGDHLAGRLPPNASANESFVSARLSCPPGTVSCEQMKLRFGPWSSFALEHRELITVSFAPRAFSSLRVGWLWTNAQVQFGIRKHKRTFAGAENVKAVVGGGAAALTAGAPAGAGKLALIADLANCPSDKVPGGEAHDDVGFTDNPLGMGVGASHTRLNFGASIMNTLVVLPLISFIQFIVVIVNWRVRKQFFDSTITFIESMAQMMFPSWLLLPGLLFYQGTLEGAFRVLYYGAVGYKISVLPVIAVLVFGVNFLSYKLTSGSYFKGVLAPYERSDTMLRKALFGTVAWESTKTDNTWVERWGFFFWDYVEACKWWMQVELWSIVALAVVGAWQPTDSAPCILKMVIIAAIFLGSAVAAQILKPYIAVYDHVMYVGVNVFECISVVCAIVMTLRGEGANTSAEESIAGFLMMVVAYSLIVKTAIDFTLFCWETWEDRRERIARITAQRKARTLLTVEDSDEPTPDDQQEPRVHSLMDMSSCSRLVDLCEMEPIPEDEMDSFEGRSMVSATFTSSAMLQAGRSSTLHRLGRGAGRRSSFSLKAEDSRRQTMPPKPPPGSPTMRRKSRRQIRSIPHAEPMSPAGRSASRPSVSHPGRHVLSQSAHTFSTGRRGRGRGSGSPRSPVLRTCSSKRIPRLGSE